jgi:glycerol-3-phosphate acyltransferase PlsX
LTTRIALDAMGGDHGPSEIIPAALDILKKHENLELILVGDSDVLHAVLTNSNVGEDKRLTIHHASESIEMHESPSSAMRNKKDSSMRVAINLVKDEVADACVSAGNTGALMAISRFVLKMLPGIDRPAICAMMPGVDGHTHILDLGANVNPNSDQLFQYAVMGAELTKAVENIENPTIGLLNVGEEEIKGNDRVKLAATLLSESHLNYVGFVEGNDIYTGKVDVIVCHGFAGNIALKASEGVAHLITTHAKNEFKKTLYGKLSAFVTMPVLNAVKRKIDPRRYNGASLLGLRGIVVKSHGSADKLSFAHAIEEAIIEVDKNVPELIIEELENVFQEKEVN